MTEIFRKTSDFLELKFADDGEAAGTFTGYASTFGGTPDSFGDIVQAGAFRDTIAEAKRTNRWPPMLLQHGGFLGGADDLTPVGIWTDLAEDQRGLKVSGRLADTPRGQEIHALMRMKPRPALSGLSIGFSVPKGGAITHSSPTKDGVRRTLTKIKLHEISIVTAPANADARVTAVKHDLQSPLGLERALRGLGYSRREAAAICRKGFDGLQIADAAEANELARRMAAITQKLTRGI